MKNFLKLFAVTFLISSCAINKNTAPIEYNHGGLSNNSGYNYSEETNSMLQEEGDVITNNSFTEPQETFLIEEDPINSDNFAMPRELKYSSHKTIYHEVKQNETIEDIANKYGQKVSSIAVHNNLQSPYNVEEFQVIKVRVPKNFDQTKPIKKIVAAKKQTIIKKKPNKVAYIKPVNGKIVKRFGEKTANGVNKGINIEAPRGTKVVSTANGRVIYADYDATFGYLILIKSNGKNVITSYAHLEDIAVSKGQKVNQGDVVGYVGDSGRVNSPQLQFGIRVGKSAKDPLKYVRY